MQHQPIMDVLRRAIRAKVCTTCYQRPPGSEALASDVPRACEGLCPIFVSAPRLVNVAVICARAPVSYEQSLRDLVCARCTIAPTAGDYCADFQARTCPLSRYAREVLAIIEQVVLEMPQKHGTDAGGCCCGEQEPKVASPPATEARPTHAKGL
jgi:hypothetical protein